MGAESEDKGLGTIVRVISGSDEASTECCKSHVECCDTPPECCDPHSNETWYARAFRHGKKYVGFIGPGLMVSIAYMDPGNYSTDVQAGAAKQFSLLFVILLANIIALFLQTLTIKLGSVTGKDLAKNCRDHLPKWVSYILYFFAEAAIIATDISEVIGTAIALNILLHIPLIAGVVLTIVDVMLVLLAYRPGKGMHMFRALEGFVAILLLAIVICFCVLLSKIPQPNVGHVFRGYVPSDSIITDGGIYMAAGILGATVMPHSLYLGSAMAVPRVRSYDEKHGLKKPDGVDDWEMTVYEPSIDAINYAYRYSVIELFVALCTVAMFVNSSILIVSAATMYGNSEAANADLYGIYDMLGQYLSKGAAVTFMIALLCSGQSAGVICTIAGQIVSEGHISWHVRPWLRRIVTRGIAIIPCLIVVACVGKRGLSDALNWTQVVLTITLPFLTAPLIYLTSRKHIMTVNRKSYKEDELESIKDTESNEGKCYANSWYTTVIGVLLVIFIGIINVYLLVEVGINGSP